MSHIIPAALKTYSVKGEQLLWGMAPGVSLYPLTTTQGRYIPDLLSIATTRWHDVDTADISIGPVDEPPTIVAEAPRHLHALRSSVKTPTNSKSDESNTASSRLRKAKADR